MTSPPLPESHFPAEGGGQRSEDLFENAPVGLWEVDATGIIIAINQTLLRRLACTRAEVVDRQTVAALVSPESTTIVQELSERCRHEGWVSGILLKWRGNGEHLYWPGEVTAAAVYSATGQWKGWRGCVQVAPQAAKETDRFVEERTLEAIERLASGVAHKFNNLLQVIQGYAELGLITLESSHPVHGNLGRIKEAAQRAAVIVQGLVTFSRRQTLRRRPLDLGSLITNMGSRLQRIVPPGIELRVTPASQHVRVLADASCIEQVLMHLVMNACEAMPEGGTVVIETSLQHDEPTCAAEELSPGTHVCLSVSDTGVGLEPELIGQIFEPFFTTKESASGLGLAVVWGLVKQHDGHIAVVSKPGHGSTFRIYLPVEERVSTGSVASSGL
jgi:PAS domain S-box-containing protein